MSLNQVITQHIRRISIDSSPCLINWPGDGSDGDLTILNSTVTIPNTLNDIKISNFRNINITNGILTLQNPCTTWIILCNGLTVNGGEITTNQIGNFFASPMVSVDYYKATSINGGPFSGTSYHFTTPNPPAGSYGNLIIIAYPGGMSFSGTNIFKANDDFFGEGRLIMMGSTFQSSGSSFYLGDHSPSLQTYGF